MPAENVPLVIDQGEDFSAQIVWTDEYGTPQNIKAPMRMDVRGSSVSAVLSLQTPTVTPPDGTIPAISYSPEIGLIQLHIPKEQTSALASGVYIYDLFVTINDGNAYAGDQVVRLLAGEVTVNRRITVMS